MTLSRLRCLAALLLSIAFASASAVSLPTSSAFAQAPAARQDKKPLTNADIIRLVKSGLADSVVVSAIEANDTGFDISADALISLKSAGVSQTIIEAMLAASSRDRSAAAQMQAGALNTPSPQPLPQAPLYALIIEGKEKRLLSLNTTARAALVKSSDNDLKSIAANQAVGAAIITGSMQAGAAIATATGSMSSLGVIGAAGSIVGGRFFRKKPTQTIVFAVSGQAAPLVLQSREPTFEVVYRDIPGVNPDDYEPVLVRLIATKDNYRIFSAVKIKDGKKVTTRPLVEQVLTRVTKLSRGHAQVAAAGPLEAGEYGLLLLPAATPQKASGQDGVVFSQSDETISLLVWDFSVAPEDHRTPPPSQAAPPAQASQVSTSNQSMAAATPSAVRQEVSTQPVSKNGADGSIAFQTTAGYDQAYNSILNVLKKEGYTFASASREAGQITTEMVIEHGAVDIGRAVVISLIKESGGLTTVQVTAYKQGRRIGGQWQEKVYTKGRAELLAEKLRAALQNSQ